VEFLRRLCADLAQIIGRAVVVSGDEGTVPSTFIQPVGLIVSELVTNAGKYGEGEVEVLFRFDQAGRVLTVSNAGPGLPADFDAGKTSGMGMRLISSLVREQRGRFSVSARDDGTGVCFRAVFPE